MEQGISEEVISKLSWVGISGAANILTCIKFAKYYELTEDDIIITVLTDSAEMYLDCRLVIPKTFGRNADGRIL
ncbi:MAG: hypothetical protein WA131_00135 [Desulfitobacteriaceae bacterium]